MVKANSDTIDNLINTTFDQSYQDAFNALQAALEHVTQAQWKTAAGNRFKFSELYTLTGELRDRFVNLEASVRSSFELVVVRHEQDPRLEEGVKRTKDYYAGEAGIMLDIIRQNLPEWIADPLVRNAVDGHITLLHERVKEAPKILDLIMNNKPQVDPKPSKHGHTP